MLLSSLRFLSSAFAAIGIVALVLALSAITPFAMAAEPLTDEVCSNCGLISQSGNTCQAEVYYQFCTENDEECSSCECVPNANNNATYCVSDI